METKEEENYKDFDELGLYLTIIESVVVSFNPIRTVEFKIIRPFGHSESELHYQRGVLVFKNVIECSMDIVNDYYEYPEFYRSAVLSNSENLKAARSKYQQHGGKKEVEFMHYYMYIDYGNKESAVDLVCQSHELVLQSKPKLLTEFEGLNE